MKCLLVIVAFTALVIGVRRSDWKSSWECNPDSAGDSEFRGCKDEPQFYGDAAQHQSESCRNLRMRTRACVLQHGT